MYLVEDKIQLEEWYAEYQARMAEAAVKKA